jgi:hypothetical protein
MKRRPTPQPAATPDTTDLPDPSAALVTPPDVLQQLCACCGAILPAPLSRLDAIPGQEHLCRAVSVAPTGNHSITFLDSGTALADALAFGRISRQYGVTAYVTTLCICGNAGDAYLACRCTSEAIAAWQRRPAFQAALAADLVVEPLTRVPSSTWPTSAVGGVSLMSYSSPVQGRHAAGRDRPTSLMQHASACSPPRFASSS